MIKPIKHIDSIDTDGKEGVNYEIIDENENDIPDGVERKNEGEEISDYDHPEPSTSESIFRFGRKLIGGRNVYGKVIGAGLDVFTFFAPAGSKIDSLRKKGKQALNLNEDKNDMKDAIKGIFQKNAWKRILNFKDEDGNFSPQEALTTVVQSAFIIGLLYAAQKLGILAPLLALLGLG